MIDVELRLPPDVQYVGLARLVVCAAARQSGMSGERVEDLRVAVSEATTNAVIVQRKVDAEAPVVLRFGQKGSTFEVSVADSGPGFEPIPAGSANGRDWSIEGGLGVTIIRQLADDVQFTRSPDGMRVKICFAVPLPDLHNGAGQVRATG